MSSIHARPTTQSALDFQGLGKLRAQARQDEKQAVHETAQQFEAMFIQHMMKTMRESIEKSELSDSHAQEAFESMFDREVAHQMAKRNSLGIADMLVKDHERRSDMLSTADALRARGAESPPQLRALEETARGMPLPSTQPSGMSLPAPQSIRPLFPSEMPLPPSTGTGLAGDRP